MRAFPRGLFGLAVTLTTLWAFVARDAGSFQRPELARIFFWHFPSPIMATALLSLGALFSWRVLRADGAAARAWDLRAEAAQELAAIFVLLTLASGIVFSKAQWGAWWQSDPRQTSFLYVSLVVCAYFVLRGAITDPERRLRQSSAYALMAYGPILFLTFVFPRLPQIQQTSFHPTNTIQQGGLYGEYRTIILLTLVLTAVLSAWCYRLRVRAGLLLLDRDARHPDPRRDSADPPVVRPVRLPAPDGP